MRCTFRRWILFAPAAAFSGLVFVICLLRGRGQPSPRLRAARNRGAAAAGALGAAVLQGLRNATKPGARQAAQQLLEAAARRDRGLSVLQVGACDGAWADTNDPVQPLLSDPRVRALLLEPAPPQWAELRQRVMALPGAEGRLLAVNAALCPSGGATSLPFYAVSSRYAVDHPEAPHWAKKEIGSLMRSHLEKHRIPAEYIEEISVPCRTPAQIFEEAGSPVKRPRDLDVLLVDAEGMDADVVNAFLELPELRPTMLVFERQHMLGATRRLLGERLRAKHYYVWDEDRRNSVAILDLPSRQVSR